jgi:hypothetical protein
MFSGEIGGLQPLTSYAVARTIGSKEMGCTRLHDASIKTHLRADVPHPMVHHPLGPKLDIYDWP